MQTQQATVGARGTDSVSLVTAPAALILKQSKIDYVMQYLGSVTPEILAGILAANLAFMPITYADRFDGAATVLELQRLSIPAGCTVWLDVEGVPTMAPSDLEAKINAWATTVQAAGYEAGMYVGAGCPLTSIELYRLKVTRYWHSLSRVIDRNGQLAEPACGWCQMQLFPSVTWGGVWVDVNFIQKDFLGRLPAWAVA